MRGEPFKSFPKPSQRRAVVKKEAKAAKKLTRRQVVEKVWFRDKGRCVRCEKKCKPPKETYPLDPDRGEVHEPDGRVAGAHLDANRCQLLCRACHFSNYSGAHIGRGSR